jgi:hypothetical protein
VAGDSAVGVLARLLGWSVLRDVVPSGSLEVLSMLVLGSAARLLGVEGRGGGWG